MNILLFKNYLAGGAIPAHTLVKLTAAGTVVAASAPADLVVGVSGELAVVAGERVDVAHVGIAPVVAGGAVSLGAAVTADASGRAAAAAGGGKRAAGIALDAASGAGDVIRILLAPHLA